MAVQCCVPRVPWAHRLHLSTVRGRGWREELRFARHLHWLLGALTAISSPDSAVTSGLFLASWYKCGTEAQKFNDLPRSRRGHRGAGIPVWGCLAFSGPPSCLRIRCSPEHSLQVRGLVAHQLALRFGAGLIPGLDLSLPVSKMQLLNWFTICSFFLKGSSFSGSHYLEQRHGAARAPMLCSPGSLCPHVALRAPSSRQLYRTQCPPRPRGPLLLRPQFCYSSCPPTPRASRQHVSLGPLPEPCVLWKGPLTFVRQGILLTPTRERGGFTSPVLSVCWLGCTPQKQNVCFLIARVLEGPLARACTPSVSRQAICPPGGWGGPGAETVSATVWPGGHHSEGWQGSGPPRPVPWHKAEPGRLTNQVSPSFSSPQAALSTSYEPPPARQWCVGSGPRGARQGAHRLAAGFQRG